MRSRSCLWYRSGGLLLAALASAMACRSTAGEAGALSTEDVAGIKATLATWKEASLAGDWPTFFAQFTEDAVWLGPQGRPAADVVAIKRGNWVRAREEELVPIQIDGRGDLAFARGSLSLLLDEASAARHEGTFLAILRKQPGGSWRMAVFSVAY